MGDFASIKGFGVPRGPDLAQKGVDSPFPSFDPEAGLEGSARALFQIIDGRKKPLSPLADPKEDEKSPFSLAQALLFFQNLGPRMELHYARGFLKREGGKIKGTVIFPNGGILRFDALEKETKGEKKLEIIHADYLVPGSKDPVPVEAFPSPGTSSEWNFKLNENSSVRLTFAENISTKDARLERWNFANSHVFKGEAAIFERGPDLPAGRVGDIPEDLRAIGLIRKSSGSLKRSDGTVEQYELFLNNGDAVTFQLESDHHSKGKTRIKNPCLNRLSDQNPEIKDPVKASVKGKKIAIQLDTVVISIPFVPPSSGQPDLIMPDPKDIRVKPLAQIEREPILSPEFPVPATEREADDFEEAAAKSPRPNPFQFQGLIGKDPILLDLRHDGKKWKPVETEGEIEILIGDEVRNARLLEKNGTFIITLDDEGVERRLIFYEDPKSGSLDLISEKDAPPEVRKLWETDTVRLVSLREPLVEELEKAPEKIQTPLKLHKQRGVYTPPITINHPSSSSPVSDKRLVFRVGANYSVTLDIINNSLEIAKAGYLFPGMEAEGPVEVYREGGSKKGALKLYLKGPYEGVVFVRDMNQLIEISLPSTRLKVEEGFQEAEKSGERPVEKKVERLFPGNQIFLPVAGTREILKWEPAVLEGENRPEEIFRFLASPKPEETTGLSAEYHEYSAELMMAWDPETKRWEPIQEGRQVDLLINHYTSKGIIDWTEKFSTALAADGRTLHFGGEKIHLFQSSQGFYVGLHGEGVDKELAREELKGLEIATKGTRRVWPIVISNRRKGREATLVDQGVKEVAPNYDPFLLDFKDLDLPGFSDTISIQVAPNPTDPEDRYLKVNFSCGTSLVELEILLHLHADGNVRVEPLALVNGDLFSNLKVYKNREGSRVGLIIPNTPKGDIGLTLKIEGGEIQILQVTSNRKKQKIPDLRFSVKDLLEKSEGAKRRPPTSEKARIKTKEAEAAPELKAKHKPKLEIRPLVEPPRVEPLPIAPEAKPPQGPPLPARIQAELASRLTPLLVEASTDPSSELFKALSKMTAAVGSIQEPVWLEKTGQVVTLLEKPQTRDAGLNVAKLLFGGEVKLYGGLALLHPDLWKEAYKGAKEVGISVRKVAGKYPKLTQFGTGALVFAAADITSDIGIAAATGDWSKFKDYSVLHLAKLYASLSVGGAGGRHLVKNRLPSSWSTGTGWKGGLKKVGVGRGIPLMTALLAAEIAEGRVPSRKELGMTGAKIGIAAGATEGIGLGIQWVRKTNIARKLALPVRTVFKMATPVTAASGGTAYVVKELGKTALEFFIFKGIGLAEQKYHERKSGEVMKKLETNLAYLLREEEGIQKLLASGEDVSVERFMNQEQFLHGFSQGLDQMLESLKQEKNAAQAERISEIPLEYKWVEGRSFEQFMRYSWYAGMPVRRERDLKEVKRAREEVEAEYAPLRKKLEKMRQTAAGLTDKHDEWVLSQLFPGEK